MSTAILPEAVCLTPGRLRPASSPERNRARPMADQDEDTPFMLRRIASEAITARESREAADEARGDAVTAADEEDQARALNSLRGAVREAGGAGARAVRLAAELIAPETLELVPRGALMAVHAMGDATEAARILLDAFTDDAGGGDEDGGDDEDGPVPVAEIPLHDAAPETMN